MSYRYRGRYTHNYQEYQRWVAEGERETLRNANQSLQGEAGRLRSELDSTREALSRAEGDVRASARLHALLAQRQQELEVIQQRMADAHQQYEERAARRQQELAAEIGRVEAHADEQIEQLRQETAEHLALVQEEVGEVRDELNEGLSEVRSEIRRTEQHLRRQVEAVQANLEEERQRRVSKEQTRSAQAGATTELVAGRLGDLQDLDSLGLNVERTRTQELLARGRELLRSDPEMALPVAESAFAAFQTAYLEREHRVGFIEGVAEHVLGLADALEQVASKEYFRLIFKAEAAQIDTIIGQLRVRARGWREQRHWITFEAERHRVTAYANEMLARSLELDATVPGLLQQLRGRELRLKEAGAAMAAITGAVDSFDKGYANEDDVKSPRLLRGHIGAASVDAYLALDGTYQVDAYGFTSAGQCGEAAARMGRKLEEQWHVSEAAVEPGNRAEPSVAPPPPEESWRRLSRSFAEVSQKLTGPAG